MISHLRHVFAKPWIVATGLALACAPTPQPPKSPPREPSAPTVADVAQEVFESYFEMHPVQATMLGRHDEDGRWPDLGPEARQADASRISSALDRLEQLENTLDTADDRVDVAMLRAELELQRFVLEVERPWVVDPMAYAQLFGSGLEELVSRDYAPVEDRAKSVVSRLGTLPILVEQAVANLDPRACLPPHTALAVEQLRGVATLIDEVLPRRLAGASDDVRARLAEVSPAALQSIERFATHLENEVVPVAAGAWRLGPENFERKLALTLQTELKAEQVHRLAVLEHGKVRTQMTALARGLAPVLFSARRIRAIERRAQGDADAALVREVLSALAEYRVEPDHLRDEIEDTLQRLEAFVQARGIVPMDEAEVLEVIWTPPHQRGVFVAGLAAPGPLEPRKAGLPSFYLVQPVPDDWPIESRESFLREYNRFMLEILSIHEAIPGHFVQLYYGKREDSLVRRVLHNGPFVEGWAVYTEHVMVDAGYAGADPESERPRGMSSGLWKVATTPELRHEAIALHGLKFYLRTVTNAIIDYRVHVEEMTRDEAMTLMTEHSFQEEGEARGKWARAQVTSTQLSTYFVGAQAWDRLARQAQERAAESNTEFDLGAFHAEALSHGAPPVHLLPSLMGWENG